VLLATSSARPFWARQQPGTYSSSNNLEAHPYLPGLKAAVLDFQFKRIGLIFVTCYFKMLCAICNSMLQSSAEEGNHHQTFEDLKKAGEATERPLMTWRYCPNEPEDGEFKDATFSLESNVTWAAHRRIESSWGDVDENCVSIHIVGEVGAAPRWYSDYLYSTSKDIPVQPWKV
jgi:hypothetical protein